MMESKLDIESFFGHEQKLRRPDSKDPQTGMHFCCSHCLFKIWFRFLAGLFG